MAVTRKYPSQIVADEFAASLANRTSPLLSDRQVKTPVNGITGKSLTGLNRLILGGRHSDPRWFTENQAKSLGYHLKPEIAGREVVFWEQYQRFKMTDPKTGKPVLDENGQQKYSYRKHERPFMKLYTVYHASQLELENGQPIPAYQPQEPKADPVAQIENIVKATGATVIHDQKGRSFYRAKDDTIHMPPMSDYQTPEGYYSDLIRELARWSRHDDRLNRPCGPFGTEAYAKEELKVNLAALAIAQSLGMTYQPGQSSQYVKDWQILVKKYPYFLAQSANEAESIKDFILDFGLSQEATATIEQEVTPSVESELSIDTVISESAQMLSNAYTTAQAMSAMDSIRAATESIISRPDFKAFGNNFEAKAIRSIDLWADDALNLDSSSSEKFEELTFKIVLIGHLHALRSGNQELQETCQRFIGDYIAAFPEMRQNLDQLVGRDVPSDMAWGNDVFTDLLYFKDKSGVWQYAHPGEITEEVVDQAVPFAVINRDEIISMDGGSLFKNWRANQIKTPGAEMLISLGEINARVNTWEHMLTAAVMTYDAASEIRQASRQGDFTDNEMDYATQMLDLAEIAAFNSEGITEQSIRRVNVSLLAVAHAWAKSVNSPEHISRYEAAVEKSLEAGHFSDLNADTLLGRNVNFNLLKEHPESDRYFDHIQSLEWCDCGQLNGRKWEWLCRENPESLWRLPVDKEAMALEYYLNRFKNRNGTDLAIPPVILPNSLLGGQLHTLDGQANGQVNSCDLRRIKGLSVSDNDLYTLKGVIRESVYRALEATDQPDLLRNNLASINLITSDDNISQLSKNHEHQALNEAIARKFHSISGTVAAPNSNLTNADLPHMQIPIAVAGLFYAELIKDFQLRDTCRKFIEAYGETYQLSSEYDQILNPVQSPLAAAFDQSGKVFGLDYLSNEVVCIDEGKWREASLAEIEQLEAQQGNSDAAIPIPILCINETQCLNLEGRLLHPEYIIDPFGRQSGINREAEAPAVESLTPGSKAIFAIGERAAKATSLQEIQQAVERTHSDTVWLLSGDPGVNLTQEEATVARQIQAISKLHSETGKTPNYDNRWLRINTFTLAAVHSLAKFQHNQEPDFVSYLDGGEDARKFEDALEKAVAYTGLDQASLETLKGMAQTSGLNAVTLYEPQDRSFDAIKKLQWCDVGVLSGQPATWVCRDSEESQWRLPSDQEATEMERLGNQVKQNTGRSMAIAVGMIPNRLIGGELMTLNGQNRGVVRSADLGQLQGIENPIDAAIPGELLKASVLKILQTENEIEPFRQALKNIGLLTSEGHVQKMAGEEEMKTEGVLLKKINSLVRGTTDSTDLPMLRKKASTIGFAFANMYGLKDLREACSDSLIQFGQQHPLHINDIKRVLDPDVKAGMDGATNSGVLFAYDLLGDRGTVFLKAGDDQWHKKNSIPLKDFVKMKGPTESLPVLFLDDDRCLTCDGRVHTTEMLSAMIAGPSMDDKSVDEGREPKAPPVGRARPDINPLAPEQELALVCEQAGMVLSGPPIMDGKKHRVPVVGGKKGSLDGEYCAHADGRPNGWVKNYKTDDYQKWVYTGHELSPEQRAEIKRSNAAVRQARREETKARQTQGRKAARVQWDRSKEAVPHKHPYLVRKNIEALGARQEWETGNLIVPGYNILERSDSNLKHLNNIQTIQTITPEGEKRFSKDCPLKGSMYIIDPKNELTRDFSKVAPQSTWAPLLPDDAHREILIAEGFATGASLHMATGKPVAVSFTAANLEPVAKNLKKVFPNIEITICADNDHKQKQNVGIEKAELAAKAVNGKVIVPVFNEAEKAQGLTDFNDLAQSRGLEALSKIITAELGRDKSAAQSQSPTTGMSR